MIFDNTPNDEKPEDKKDLPKGRVFEETIKENIMIETEGES